MILTEICQYLKNWFDRNQKKWIGKISISNEGIRLGNQVIELVPGQYYRIIGSLFNDGVHLNDSSDALIDEPEFEGAIWSMAIPPAVVELATEIEEWQSKYGGVGSVAMSPFNSESFGGYSYSKSGGGSGDGERGAVGTWQGVYGKRLSMWRKI